MHLWVSTTLLLCCIITVSAASSKSKLHLTVKTPGVINTLRVGDDVIITCQLIRPTTEEEQHEVKSINLYVLHATGNINLFSWSDGYLNAANGSRWEKSKIRVVHNAPASMCYNGEIYCEVTYEEQAYSKHKPMAVTENPTVSMNVGGDCVTCDNGQSSVTIEADSAVTVSCNTEDFRQTHTVDIVTEPQDILKKFRSEVTPKNCAEGVYKEAALYLEPAQQVHIKCIVKDGHGKQLFVENIQVKTEADPVVHLHMGGRCLTCKEENMTLIESNIVHRASCKATGFTNLLNVSMMLNNTLQAKVAQGHVCNNSRTTSELMSSITLATGENRMWTCRAYGKDAVAERNVLLRAVSPEPKLYINSVCISCKDPPEITIEKMGWDTKVKCRVPNLPSVQSLEIEGLPASPDELIHLEKKRVKFTHISRSARVRFDPDDDPYELFCNVTTIDGVTTQGARTVVTEVQDQTGIDFLQKGNAMLLYLLIPSGIIVICVAVYMIHRTFVQKRPSRTRRFSHRISVSEPDRHVIRSKADDSQKTSEVRKRLT